MAIIIRDVRTIATAPDGINLLVVKIETSEPGLYGIGCSTFCYRYATVQHLIETYLKPLLIGRPVQGITDLWQLMHQNGYWRSGPIENNAISGIDMALWDIKGKMADMPVYDLFGGKVRAGVPVYTHADGRDLPELCEQIDRWIEQGFKHIRCQINCYGGNGYESAPAGAAKGGQPGVYIDSNGYMRQTVAMFEQLRVRYGEEIEFVHDVHERIHPSKAREFCRALDPYHLFFIEDVVAPEQVGWLREIHNYCATPLALGELYVNDNEWRTSVVEHSVDFVRAHISDIGGITPARRMAAFAEPCGVRTCWHGPSDMSPVAKAANIHLDLASPNFGLQEWSIGNIAGFLAAGEYHEGALEEVFTGTPEYGGDGFVYASERPGLGVDINEEAAAKYPCRVDVTTWTQTRNQDGSLQTP